MKGQLNLSNVLNLVFGMIFYAIVGYPIVTLLINNLVLDLQASPTAYTTAMVMLLQLTPIGMGIGFLITIWFFATPHQEAR